MNPITTPEVVGMVSLLTGVATGNVITTMTRRVTDGERRTMWAVAAVLYTLAALMTAWHHLKHLTPWPDL